MRRIDKGGIFYKYFLSLYDYPRRKLAFFDRCEQKSKLTEVRLLAQGHSAEKKNLGTKWLTLQSPKYLPP